MCYNCGCGMPDDNMGNADNITNSTIKHLSEHWGKSTEEVQQILISSLQKDLNGQNLNEDPHIKEMFEKAAYASGQTIEDAKKNTLEMLQKQVGQKSHK